ncbi:MAG: hypothetical protein US97_C0008G0001, partial [Microgenomates group bacterium GW2011_GWF1_38_5]
MTDDFISYRDFEDVDRILSILPDRSEEYWLRGSLENGYKVFELLRDKIPVYKKYLLKHNIDIRSIKSPDDFHKLPIMVKEDYLKHFKFEELLIGGPDDIKSFYMSSGSSGEPSVWPRLEISNIAYSYFVNFYYTFYWKIDKRKTLYISALDLGVWASGNLQFHAASYCAHRHSFTFANPGADYPYIYQTLKKLSEYYDQIIIASYPSFARRLLDYLESKKDINIKKLNIHFMLGGEPHTVEWRQYILQKIGLPKEDLTGVMDYYGTSDSGGPGSSTPLTTLIQNLCLNDNNLCFELFNQRTVPSLFQQNPTLYVESVNGNILVSYPGQLPLCRYDSGDTGGVLKYSEVIDKLSKCGYDVLSILKKRGFYNSVWKWSFVYLTGRSDLSINIGGAIVYPRDIEGLFFSALTRNINSFKLSVENDE